MATRKKLEQTDSVVSGSDPRLTDKIWRLNHIYKIKDINREIVTFKMNHAQRDFHEKKHNRNIILKSRRLGFTTYESIDSIDDALFMKNSDNLILSYDQPSQLDIFDNKVILAWDNLDEHVKSLWSLDADRSNKLKFDWGDGGSSSIVVRSHGRSGTFSRVHISEFAKICRTSMADAKEILSGTIQAVPMNGRVDIESTAEGDSGLFYDMFWEAYNRGEPTNPAEYKAFFYNWQYDEGEMARIVPIDPQTMPGKFQAYQLLHTLTDREITYYYLKWLSLNKDWDMLHQEYPTTPEEAFQNSGINLFSIDKVNAFKIRDGERVGDWIYYADYRPGHRYGLGADPSEGIGRDNATIAIIDFDAKPCAELVAIYCSDKIAPDTFAYEIKNGATRYGNCIACVERNNHGFATLATLKNMYANIYKEFRMTTSMDVETDRLGFHATAGSNALIEYNLSTAINEDEFNCPDIDTVQELKTYPKDAMSRRKDVEGKHWDKAKAVMIAYHMLTHSRGNKITTVSSDDQFDSFNPVMQF